MRVLTCSLLVLGAVALASGQANQLNNRCLDLLRDTTQNQSQFNKALGTCLSKAREQQGRVKDSLLRILTATCIGAQLGYVSPDGKTLYKDKLRSAIYSNNKLTRSQKDNFAQRLDRCRNFNECVTRECGV